MDGKKFSFWKRFFEWSSFFGWGVVLGCRPTTSGPSWPDILSQVRRDFPAAQQLSTDELSDWLSDDERDPPQLLDTRSVAEFEQSHLAGAKLAPDLTSALKECESLDKSTPIVVYCSVGYRSSRLAEQLQGAGFLNVHNLEGSLFRWANEGRPLVNQKGTTQWVHPYDAHWGQLLEPHCRAPLTSEVRD